MLLNEKHVRMVIRKALLEDAKRNRLNEDQQRAQYEKTVQITNANRKKVLDLQTKIGEMLDTSDELTAKQKSTQKKYNDAMAKAKNMMSEIERLRAAGDKRSKKKAGKKEKKLDKFIRQNTGQQRRLWGILPARTLDKDLEAAKKEAETIVLDIAEKQKELDKMARLNPKEKAQTGEAAANKAVELSKDEKSTIDELNKKAKEAGNKPRTPLKDLYAPAPKERKTPTVGPVFKAAGEGNAPYLFRFMKIKGRSPRLQFIRVNAPAGTKFKNVRSTRQALKNLSKDTGGNMMFTTTDRAKEAAKNKNDKLRDLNKKVSQKINKDVPKP